MSVTSIFLLSFWLDELSFDDCVVLKSVAIIV